MNGLFPQLSEAFTAGHRVMIVRSHLSGRRARSVPDAGVNNGHGWHADGRNQDTPHRADQVERARAAEINAIPKLTVPAASRPEAGQVQRERDRRSPCPSCNPRLDGLQGAGAAGAYAVADDDDLGEFVDQDDRGEAENTEGG